MEHTIENVVKVLKAMERNNRKLAEYFDRDQKTQEAKSFRSSADAYYTAILALTDNDSFDAYVDIYDVKED